MSVALLQLSGIVKQFAGVRALDGVSLSLERGEVHALCGENGAGKSTLMKVISGYYAAGSFEGQLELDGKPIRFRSLRDAEAQGIALIAQELALVPGLSIAENLVLGHEPSRYGLMRWDLVNERAQRALRLVGLDLDPSRRVGDLGVGQQQLVEIAKALGKDARILVLDEPTAALTDVDAQRLLALVRELRGRGVACLYVSHRLDEVFAIADRITILRDGRSIATQATAETSRARVIALMVGREVGDLHPRPATTPGAPVLSVSGWSVADPARPGRLAVDDVAFEVRAGEVLGIGGLMGAGRTALLSSLFGAANGAVHGQLRLLGVERAPFRTPQEAIAAGVALVSEDRKRFGLVLTSSLRDNFTLATLRKFLRHGLIDHTARDAAASAQASALRVKMPGLQAVASALSGGNQQKVVLGKWLLTRPRVLLLDEPTRGVDVGARAEIYALIGRLAEAGLAIVMASSDLPELLGVSHRVLVLSGGRATALLSAEEATSERVMDAAIR